MIPQMKPISWIFFLFILPSIIFLNSTTLSFIMKYKNYKKNSIKNATKPIFII